MILYIDATDYNKVTFALSQMSSRTRSLPRRQAGRIQINKDMDSRLRGNDKKKVLKKSYKIKPYESFETLGFLDKFLTLSFDRVTPSDDGVKSVGTKSTSLAPWLHSGHSPHVLSSTPRSLRLEERRGIRKIYVNKGPGSYTGVRVGVTIAQALGFAWNIPVKFLPKDKFFKG